jgi:glycosyltransferase involved in cell wall biosynthesis
LRILQVIPFFYPAFSFGGPVRAVYDISRQLVERGNDVVVYTSDAKDLNHRINFKDRKIDDLKINYLRNINMMIVKKSKFFITPSLFLKAKKEVRSFNIIHLHEYRTFQNIIIMYYARKYGVPYILQAHGSLLGIMGKRSLKLIYDKLFGYKLLEGASMVIALNQTEAKQYMHMGVSEKKIVIIPNGIDLAEYTYLPAKGSFKNKFSINDNTKIVLFLGRLNRIKGVDVLVKGFAKLVETFADVKLVIVGPDDGFLGKIKALVTNLRIDNKVLITGPLYGKSKLEAYVDADVYVLPSKYEIWGLTVLEAYACGKPVIASNIAGLKELVKNLETGLLFNRQNAQELADQIVYLLTNQDRAKDMGLKGKEIVYEKYKIENVVNELAKVYSKYSR